MAAQKCSRHVAAADGGERGSPGVFTADHRVVNAFSRKTVDEPRGIACQQHAV